MDNSKKEVIKLPKKVKIPLFIGVLLVILVLFTKTILCFTFTSTTVYTTGSSTSKGGINFNRELYNVKYEKTIHSPNIAYQNEITQKQLLYLIDYCNKNNYYSTINHNCVTIARDAWNQTCNDCLISSDTPYLLYCSMFYRGGYFKLDLSGIIE